VGIPKDERGFRTKGEIAYTMIKRARRAGLRFSYSVFDGGYGHLPWLLRDLDDEGEVFLAEIHSDQLIYLEDPAPSRPKRGPAHKGRKPTRWVTQALSQKVAEWAQQQPASA
jgi:hypothetical protein